MDVGSVGARKFAAAAEMAVAKKSLDNEKLQGQQAVKLIDGAAQPLPPDATFSARV